ncbi:hypothetical protein PP178_04095 [Zeaxanthinibacter sp. PT1]|uniref:hypothetical protein n=1 Tax=Zeaxanthinibacter TaxID=561554 RepID=UPI00234A2056|nr:hypothetical protein [Zeaxanthinibacter sp. PT1]MDC6350722.1 hypothetical protein [Zeaxanthinibacter sp. PT1]
MNRIIAMRSGRELTVNINGKSFFLYFEEDEKSIEAYKKVLEFKQNPTDESVEKLQKFVSPSYRMNFDLNGVLQRNRRGEYFMGNTEYPLPQLILDRFKEHLEHDLPLEPLRNFWTLLMLNDNDQVKSDLFKFMENFKMPITDNGYFIAYKSVAFKGEKDKDLGIFVSQQYVTHKAAGIEISDKNVVKLRENSFQIMDSKELEEYTENAIDVAYDDYVVDHIKEWIQENYPKEYILMEDNRGKQEDFYHAAGCTIPSKEILAERILQSEYPDFEVLGSLEDMFKGISDLFDYESPVFTDWHTRSAHIELGKPVSMPMEEVDRDPNRTCSSGLHVGAPGYVSTFGGYGMKTYILACLVNPMNVGAVPYDYNGQKMRVSEYLPYAVCEFQEGKIMELDTEYFEDDYINFEKELLETKLEELQDEEENEEAMSLIKNRLVTIG